MKTRRAATRALSACGQPHGSPRDAHSSNGAWKPVSRRLPRRPHSLVLRRKVLERNDGNRTTIAVGIGDRSVTCRAGRARRASSRVVSRAVSTRGTVQVLAGILLRAADGALELAATDMELSLRTTLAAEVEGDGAVVVPGKLLADLARLLPDDEVVDRAPAGGRRRVRSPRARRATGCTRIRRRGLPAPAVGRRAAARDRPRRRCSRRSARVARSASRDESRPVLTGILVRFEGRQARRWPRPTRTGSPSRRRELDGRGAGARGDHPGPRARRSSRGSRRGGDDASSSACTRTTSSSAPATPWLTTRRIDGQFPNYRQLLPETFEHRARRCRARAARRRPPRRGDGAAQLAAAAPLRRGRADDLGADARTSARRASRCRSPYAGEPLEIGFNAEFLREGSSRSTADDVR